MLDWFRGEVPFHHDPLPAGQVLSFEADGSVEWISVKKIRVERESHESAIHVRSVGGDGHGFATALQIDGNPAKFLQGHNVFGSRDLNMLVALTFQRIYEAHKDHLEGWSNPELAFARIKRGEYDVKGLHINEMYDLGNDASVEAWLHAAEMRARTRSGRSTRDKGTVYAQKNSRRWAFKFYNKFREMAARGKSHKLPHILQGQGLEDFARGKLRAELVLMSMELKEMGVTKGYHVTEEWVSDTFARYLGRVEMPTQATLIDEQLLNLPRAAQSSYQLWRQGVSLKDLLPKPTFYRHRKILMEQGIDITVPPLSPDTSNVVPLIRVLEAVPVGVPAWAFDRKLVAGWK